MIKSFTKYILTLVAILMVTSNAWAARYAEAHVQSEPSEGGLVFVNSENSGPTSWNSNMTTYSNSQKDSWATGSKTFTFYRFYKENENYTFKGWSTNITANRGDGTSSCTITATITNGSATWDPAEQTYYAIFATLQYPANKDVVFADTKKDEELSQTIVIKHAHAGNLTLSLSDNTNFKITSASSINSVSLNANQEVIVTFCPKTTGNHTATLTIKSDNGLSDLTITLKGKATDIYTPVAEKKVDEIFKNASYPLNEVFDVYYLANDQKNPLNDYTINALNPHIANCIDGTIYTNHNTGSAGFVLTRAANNDFYALNETIYVEVTANNQDCDLPISSTSTTTTNDGTGYSNPINLNGSGKTLTFTYRLNEGAGATHYITPQYSTTENADDFQNISNDNTYNTKTTTPTTQSLNLPAGTKRIRFKRTSDWTGSKYFIISDISVTRNTSLAATQTFTEDKPLTLPPVAINQQSSANFYINWSTCSNIQLACDNSKFTISPSSFSAAEGTEQKIAVSCNTSEIGTFNGTITIYDQATEVKVPVTCTVNNKWLTDSISGSATYSMKVDETWGTDFYFPVQRASQYPTTDGPFHYAIINQTFEDENQADRNPNYPNEVISYNNGVITAHNAGTAILTIKHEETAEHFESQQFTCTITVSKHDVERIWNDPVYFNDTIYNYFTTSNTVSPIVIESQTDTDVARLTNEFNPTSNNSLDLITFNKEEVSTTVTVSQVETYYWNGYSEPHTITSIDPDNHVTFTIDSNDKMNNVFKYSTNNADDLTWDNGIRLGDDDWVLGSVGGDKDGGYDWSDKYIIIEFTGIPDTLYLTTDTDDAATTGTESDLFFYISEGYMPQGASTPTFTQTWEYKNQSNNVAQKLNPDTRFVKLCYTGNLRGWFKGTNKYSGVTVTELNEFIAVDAEENHITEIDLGAKHQVGTTNTASFNFKYANAGYKVKFEVISTDNAATAEARKFIKLSHNDFQTINNEQYLTHIGGEKYGTIEGITVSLSTTTEEYTIPAGTMIKITDEAGHEETVLLKGSIVRANQDLSWKHPLFLKDPVILPLKSGRLTELAESSRPLEVTYESSNPEVIKVSDDGKSITPLKEGEVTITAKQEGNLQFNPATPIRKPVIVTDKIVQIIICTDDLSDLIQGGSPITLSAKVYWIDMENQGQLQYSEKQTAQLQYTVLDNTIASIDGNVLTPLGLGTTKLQITVPGDDLYKEDAITVPIRVRPATVGCEDILLLDDDTSIEFYKFDLQRPEIISNTYTIDHSKGIPGTLEFQHTGKPWTLAIEYYDGTIVAEQSVDGQSWTEVTIVEPTKNETNFSLDNPLDRNAKYIRFRRPKNGIGYHYISNVKVHPAQYIESDPTVINFGEIHIGAQKEFVFTINYSNIKHELSPKVYSAPDQVAQDVVFTQPTEPFGDCNAFGSQTISGVWTPQTGGLDTERTITFTDAITSKSATVVLKANVLKKDQRIVWENRPNTIDDATDIDSRPEKTKNDLGEDALDIIYEVINGTEFATFDANGNFFLKGTGEITIRAYNNGNFEYNEISETFIFNITNMPPTFVGGASDNLWTNHDNWANKVYPETADKPAVVIAPALINTSIQVSCLSISTSGSVHITSTGGLDVGEGGIQASATDGSAIVIDNLHEGAGYLRVNPAYTGTMPRITMRYQTRSTLDNGANLDAEWQYIGAPGLNSTIYVDHNTWLYKLDEPEKDWVLQPRTADVELEPFEGYAITQYGTPTYEWTADFTNQNCTIPLTYSKNGRSGRHIIANSYTAPINVAAFTGDEFKYLDGMDSKYRIEKTLYIYNSGSWNNWNNNNGSKPETSGNEAGQYYAIPVLAAQYLAEDDQEQTTIAPMQGIYLRVRSRKAVSELPEDGEPVGNLYLDYNSLVMGNSHEMNHPMRAPQKNIADAMQSENFRRVRIVATSEKSGADRLYIIQDDINTRKYNNGYDAPNQETKGLVNIYTNESGGKMEVSCSNNIDSMYIGFMAGEDRTYTLHFSALIGDVLYLQDLMNGQEVRIVENGSYTFEADPQSTNDKRFLLLTSSKLATNIDDTHAANIWYSNSTNTLYITNALDNSTLVLYDASGHQVLSTTISHTPYTINLSYLTKGMYMARINNHVYKFVCK